MEFTKKAKDLKRVLPRFRHRLAERCRRLFAVVICASMVLSGFPSGFFQAFAADEGGDYVFELDRASLYEALDAAIADGTTLDSELRFLGDHKEEYDELFEPDGTLYELEDLETDKDRERDRNVELRVFVRIEGDIGLDEAYEADGTEEVLFLLSNKTDDEISVKIILDDRETEVITIPAAKDISAEFDKDLPDEVPEQIPETVELEAGPGAAGGAGGGADAAGDAAYVDDEAADEEADEEPAAEDAADAEDEVDSDSDAAEEDIGEDPAEGSDKESEAGLDEGSDKETSSDDASDNSDADTGSDDRDSSDDKGSSHDRGFSGGRGSSDDKESSDKESSDNEASDKESSKDKDDSKDVGSSKDKESTDGDSSKGKGSDKKDSSRSRGSSEKHSDDSSKEEKTASVSVNKNTLLMASIDLDYTEAESEEDAGAEEAASYAVEEADAEGSEESVVIAASPSNSSPSNASPSDASKIIDGTVYEPVRLGNRGAVAFATTTEDIGLMDDLDIITTLTYEGEDYIVTVSYGKDAGLPKDVKLSASEYEKDSDTFQARLAEIAEFNDWDESRFEERVVYDDENDEEGHAESIVDRIRLFNISLNSDGAEVEPGAEVEVQISLLDSEEPGEDGGCYSVFHFADTEIEAIDPTNEYEDEVQTITFSVSSFSDIMLLSETDHEFTLQFYAYIDQILTEEKAGDDSQTVIDTSGQNLPKNSGSSTSSYQTSVVDMADDGKGGYYLDFNKDLVEMYTAETYDYDHESTIETMDKLQENPDYVLSAVWVLKEGATDTSTVESDWTIYPYTDDLTFTNNESNADSTTIYIADGAVLRFVYNTSAENDVTIIANMYDYNICDGNVYNTASTTGGLYDGSGTKYVYTNQQGINSASNYTGSGAKYAFGNNNTWNGLDSTDSNQTWSNNGYSNLLNTYNSNGLRGCTFSLVTGWDEDTNNVNFNNGIAAPKVFGDETAIGKQTYSGIDLLFTREGDTYTLTGVEGTTEDGDISLTDLDTFTHPGSYNTLYTNNFWPLDEISYDGMDPLFGGSSSVRYFGNNEGNMPASDDGIDHNSYFGMNFAIEFSYTKDYVGPLEYFFFGDDDMWVFLDNTLVLDIGGVHSTVGEHVNLWDYLKNEQASMSEDDVAYHTLNVFYTERGASGSTCYIRYTLPTVSSATLIKDTGDLVIYKQVENAPEGSDEEFHFNISLMDETGSKLQDEYSYTIYSELYYEDDGLIDADGNWRSSHETSGDEIKSGNGFDLKDGWYIQIHYLPVGAYAIVTEASADGYSTTWAEYVEGDLDSTDPDRELLNGAGTTVTSRGILDEETRVIVFTNTAGYILPATGGKGRYPFQIAGALMLVSSAILLYELLRRRRLTIRK